MRVSVTSGHCRSRRLRTLVHPWRELYEVGRWVFREFSEQAPAWTTTPYRQQLTEVRGVGLVVGPPKSRAGLRTVSVPASILPQLREHLATFVTDHPDALVFTGPTGTPIWRATSTS